MTKLRQINCSALILSLFLLLLPANSSEAQGMPAGHWAGFWKFIPSKSIFPGPPPRIDQFTIEPDGTVHVHEMSAEGKVRDWFYTPEEGKPVPVQGRGPNVTVVVRKVSPYRIEHSWNFNGLHATSYSTLSKDGEIQIFHIHGIDRDGKPYREVAVYRRTQPEGNN